MSAAPSRVVRSRVLAAVAMAASLTAVLTVGVRPTFASWVTSTRLGQPVGVASSTCTTPGVYRTKASSRFLAGSVAGVTLANAGALAPITADNPASTATFSSGATPRGGDGASAAVANPAIAAAVQSAGGVVGLTAPSGSQTQYAAATSTGTSVAGAGAVTNGGAIDTAGMTGGTRPAVGAVDVSAALGAAPGGAAAAGQLSQLGLTIGAAASAETLNECARRWGASLSSALTRTSALSGLSLSMKDAALTALLAAVATQRGSVSSTFTGLSGTDATSTAAATVLTTAKSGLASAVATTLQSLSPNVVVGQPTGSVSISSSVAGATTAASGTATAGSGLATVDGGAGTITADLSKLADPTRPAPNTAVVTAAGATSISTAASTAAGSLVSNVGSAWDAATSGTLITVDVTVPASSLGVPLLTVHQQMSGTLADFLDSGHAWAAPDVTSAGSLSTGSLLAALLPNIRTSMLGPVQSAVSSAVSAPASTAVTNAKAALATALSTMRSALPSQLATLATLLSITLDEQPDVAPYPTAAAGLGGGYVVTALRVRVKVAGADALDLAIASSSVGPDTTVNQ